MKPRFRMAILAAALAFPAIAQAGPVADFEKDLREAYESYRSALAQTVQGEPGKGEQGKAPDKGAGALQQLEERWNGLMKKWSETPPPHFLDDPKFAETMKEIGRIAEKAKGEIAAAGQSAAHESLEKIRALVGDMRQRNGLLTYSDRVNEYHEAMEKAAARDWSKLDAEAFGELRERAAVLVHLAAELQRTAPQAMAKEADFDALAGGVTQSADALLKAARKSDEAAAREALKGLKPAYSKFFVRFG